MENFNNHILNSANLINNYNKIKKHVGTNVKVCAMVKANAYGHGLKDVCIALKHADFFGVASCFEAKQIRKFNKQTPILIVGVTDPNNVLWCAQNNVSVTVSTFNELKLYSLICGYNKLHIHLKINSGLNRIGFDNINHFKKSLNFIKHSSNIILEGVFTHFATKGEDVEFIVNQHNRFMEFIKYVKSSNVIVHCCNSFSTIMFSKYHHSMVRCGYNLYGWQQDNKICFNPVLKITSSVVFVHNIKKGESVGYDRTFVASKNTKIAIVAMGYADGFDRRLSNKFSVLVNGEWAKVVGNICMDVFMIDVTNIKNVEVGSVVTIIGRNGGKQITPNDYAIVLDTSPYEVLLKFKTDRMNKIITNTLIN